MAPEGDQAPNSSESLDIGQLLAEKRNIAELTREQMYSILKAEPNPDTSAYPRTRRGKVDRHGKVDRRGKVDGSGTKSQPTATRQFLPSWFKQYNWIHYSRYVDGVFCRFCVLFGPEKAGGCKLGQFIKTPFNNWRKKTERMNEHSKSEYHHNSTVKAAEFLARYTNRAFLVYHFPTTIAPPFRKSWILHWVDLYFCNGLYVCMYVCMYVCNVCMYHSSLIRMLPMFYLRPHRKRFSFDRHAIKNHGRSVGFLIFFLH